MVKKKTLSECSISIVVPTRNRVNMLPELISSLKRQDFKNFTCCFVDNGPSTDGTGQFLRKISKSDKRFRIVSVGPVGIYAACNLGVKDKQGDIFLILDDDVELLDQSTLTEIVCHFHGHDDLGILQIGEYYLDGKGKQQINNCQSLFEFNILDLWHNTSNYTPGRISKWGVIGTKLHNLPFGFDHSVDHVRSSCMAVRASLFRKLGGFNETYFIFERGYRCETDLCVRAKKLGYKVIYSNKSSQVLHKLAPKTTGWKRGARTSFRYVFATNRNNTFFFLRNFWSPYSCLLFMAFDLFIGNSQQPGIIRLIRWGPRTFVVFFATVIGKLSGFLLYFNNISKRNY